MSKVEILEKDDRRTTGFDVNGHVSIEAIIKALIDAGILLRGENITAVYPTKFGIGYYANLD